jgi:hypothetical protein
MSLEQAWIIYSKYSNNLEYYNLLKTKLKGFDEAIDYLTENDYIIFNGIDFILTEKSMALFKDDSSEWFNNLWNKYPQKYGTRRLRLDREKCKQIFNTKIRSNDEYERAINGLKIEIDERIRSNSMGYMLEFSRWLKNKRWETYLDENKSETNNNDMKDDI